MLSHCDAVDQLSLAAVVDGRLGALERDMREHLRYRLERVRGEEPLGSARIDIADDVQRSPGRDGSYTDLAPFTSQLAPTSTTKLLGAHTDVPPTPRYQMRPVPEPYTG
jgi:hypothetical protein